jgi:hypothetical protein
MLSLAILVIAVSNCVVAFRVTSLRKDVARIKKSLGIDK